MTDLKQSVADLNAAIRQLSGARDRLQRRLDGADLAGAPSAQAPATELSVEFGGPIGGTPTPLVQPLVALVVGHEPKRPGAVNRRSGLSEYVFNNDLANAIRRNLRVRNFIKSEIVFRQPEGYGQLPSKINVMNPALVVSLHANAYNERATGTETLYYRASENGKRLASLIQAETVRALQLADRGVKAKSSEDRGGYLLANTKAPAVICEPFFIDNDSDLSVALSRKSELAEAVSRAIERYFGFGNLNLNPTT